MSMMQRSSDSEVSPTATEAVAAGCPMHAGRQAIAPVEPAVSGCPMHFDQHVGAERSAADVAVRRLLRISDAPTGGTTQAAYSAFQRSMLISATRCTLTYVVFPFVLPALSFGNGLGPILGIVIGVIAIVCDVFSVRRFFAVDHRWRWRFGAVAAGVIGLLGVLLVQDIIHLVT